MIRSSEYDKLELKHQNLFYSYKLIVALLKKMSWCETEMQKYMPLVKQNVMKFEVLDKELIRKEIRDGGEGVERGLRWKHKR